MLRTIERWKISTHANTHSRHNIRMKSIVLHRHYTTKAYWVKVVTDRKKSKFWSRVYTLIFSASNSRKEIHNINLCHTEPFENMMQNRIGNFHLHTVSGASVPKRLFSLETELEAFGRKHPHTNISLALNGFFPLLCVCWAVEYFLLFLPFFLFLNFISGIFHGLMNNGMKSGCLTCFMC